MAGDFKYWQLFIKQYLHIIFYVQACSITIYITLISYTVESQYLELGYLEFCETRSVYLNEKYISIAFSNHHLVLETFLQVQITRSAN